MSKKTDNLQRLIQDLASRYGKDDTDVQKLSTELIALKAMQQARRECRRTALPTINTSRRMRLRTDGALLH